MLIKIPIFEEYYRKNSPIKTSQNSFTEIIKKRKSSFRNITKNLVSFPTENELIPKIQIQNKIIQIKKPFQKSISINTNGMDSSHKKQSIEGDSSNTTDSNSIPTDKFEKKTFNFEHLNNHRKTPNSSNRSLISSKFLINKLGMEKYEKMKELIENCVDPLKSIEGRKKILEIIGENNADCLEICKFILNNKATPSNANQRRIIENSQSNPTNFHEKNDFCCFDKK